MEYCRGRAYWAGGSGHNWQPSRPRCYFARFWVGSPFPGWYTSWIWCCPKWSHISGYETLDLYRQHVALGLRAGQSALFAFELTTENRLWKHVAPHQTELARNVLQPRIKQLPHIRVYTGMAGAVPPHF